PTAMHTVSLAQLIPRSGGETPLAFSDQLSPRLAEISTVPPSPAAMQVDPTQLIPCSQTPDPWLDANHADPFDLATSVPESPPAMQSPSVAQSIARRCLVAGEA